MNSKKSFIFNIICLVFSILFIISLIRTMTGAPILTFAGFLERLPTVPQINLANLTDFTIIGDWGVFEFLRNFINIFATPLTLVVYISAQLINLILFVGWCLKFFFVG